MNTAILSIDLDALAANWRLLKDRLNGADCGASIKADAYGLGAKHAALTLHAAGCRHFFVALPGEGVSLRQTLEAGKIDATIHLLCGPLFHSGTATGQACIEHRLIPVLNSLEDIAAWKAFRPDAPADIHVDTGMLRLGLAPDELATLAAEPDRLAGMNISHIISHPASADESASPQNRRQLDDFTRALRLFPGLPASFANSSGVFLGPDYHFDLARPGSALYGINPTPGKPNPMAQVIRLQGKILQIRDVDTPQTVGYGATHTIARKGRVATVGVGYADGYLRALSNKGFGILETYRVPLVGRVSMDLITFDVTDIPDGVARPGAMIDLIGPGITVDEVAATAGTIGYEILTGLGQRYHRLYLGGAGK